MVTGPIRGDNICWCFFDALFCAGRYSTWRVVLYVLSSVIAFLLIFFLCWTCLKYLRRRRDAPVDYPMQPMGYPPYGYPQPTQPQSTANPAMYSYPPQNGYPVNGYPAQMDNQQHPPPPSSKVPGPSGTVWDHFSAALGGWCKVASHWMFLVPLNLRRLSGCKINRLSQWPVYFLVCVFFFIIFIFYNVLILLLL